MNDGRKGWVEWADKKQIDRRNVATMAQLAAERDELREALEESLKEMDAFQAYWNSPKMGLKRGSSIAQEKARAALAKARPA